MSNYRQLLTAFVCAIGSVATCPAQNSASFHVVSSTNTINSNSGWTPLNIYAVDVNNDGIPDLIQDTATTGFTNGNGQFGVSLSNGDGTFRAANVINYPPGVVGASPMAFGDFNGDGKMDIAMSAGGNTVAIYLGNGDGTFVNPWYSNLPLAAGQSIAGWSPFVAADFNHDGKLDLAIAGTSGINGTTTVYILPGEGNGLFTQAIPIFSAPTGINASSSAIQNMMIGDFDSDDNADLALNVTTGNSEGGVATSTIHVLYGAGDFSFADTTPLNIGGGIQVIAGDLNSDGYTDLFAIDPNSNYVYTLYGQGGRGFALYSETTEPIYFDGAENMPTLSMADFNDDGQMDLVLTSTVSGKLYMVFLLGAGAPGQYAIQTWDILTYGSVSYDTAPVVADFDGDSKPDFAFVHYTTESDSTIYTGLNEMSHGNWSNCTYPSAGRGINLCSPAGSSTGTVNFSAAAHSYGQLRKMELWVDGRKLGEQHNTWQNNAFFNFSSTVAAGDHVGTIYSADVDNTLQRFDFNFTVGPSSCGAPSSDGVNICSPVSGSNTSASPVLVQATSTIGGSLARMEVWVDGVKKYSEFDSTSLDASIGLPPGTHQFTVFAVNTDGTLWDQTVTATVP